MFGAVIPGRPLLSFQQVNPKKFLLTLPAAHSIREIVFLAYKPEDLPKDHGMTIYYCLSNDPNKHWEYLGSLSAHQPSALIRTPWLDLQNPDVQVQFGLSLETEEFIRNVDEGKSDEERVVNDIGMAIGKNLYTFMSSFAQQTGRFKDLGDVLVIPTSCIDRWWAKFREKHQRLPYFFMKK